MSTSDFRRVDFPPTELFTGLTPQEVDFALSAAKLRRYRAKSIIYRQGESAQHLLLLREGRARYFYQTSNGKKLILRWILAGHSFGLAGLSPQTDHYIVSAEAVKDSVVVVWDTRSMSALTQRLPRLMENGFFTTYHLFSWYIAAHAALCSQTPRERLSQILFEYATKVGRKVAGGIEVDATNQELADAANINLFTTSRLMSAWKSGGLIHRQRGKILLRSPGKLFQREKETDRGRQEGG